MILVELKEFAAKEKLEIVEKARPGGGCGGEGALAAAREIRSNLLV